MDRNHLARKGFRRPDAAVEEGGDARVGFAGAGFDAEKPWEAHKSKGRVSQSAGSSVQEMSCLLWA